MKLESAITTSLIMLLILSQVFSLVGAESVAGGAPNSWASKAPWPLGGAGYEVGGVAVVSGTIYVFSGGGNYFYDPATDNWTAFAPMPTPMAAFAVAACDNKIYILGGEDPPAIPTPTATATPSSQSSLPYSAVNEVYDPSTNTWATEASMPISVIEMAADTVNGEIYVIGGAIQESSGQPPLSAVGMTEIYNPAANSWSTGASMPYPVFGAASAVVDNKIYVMGGQDEYNYPDINVNFTQIYDPASDSWSLGTPMPVATFSAAAGATIGAEAPKRIYVFGGSGGFGVGLDQNYAYDPVADNWTAAAPMPSARYSPAVAVVDDVLYVIGGGQGRTSAIANEQYTPIGYGTPDPAYVLEYIPPKISIISPLNETYNESSVPLTFSVDKSLNWSAYSLDAQQNITLMGNQTLGNLKNGSHSLTIYANDTYGNVGASETINFTVAAPQPYPTEVAAVILGAVVAAVIVAAIIVLKKRLFVKIP